MKRYLVFSGDYYYPSGGWGDFDKDFDDLDEAVSHARERRSQFTWAQVVDMETGTEVPLAGENK